MHRLIESIEIEYDQENSKVTININDIDKEFTITASVTKSGTFRFSYTHPENGNKYSYKGVFMNKNKVMIYPIIGDGVISDKFIKIKEDQ